MSRYIDADKLESELFRDGIAGIFLNYPRRIKFTIGEIRGMLKNERIAPTADVVEVRHGEWEIKSRLYRLIDDFDEEIYVECPFCKRTFYVPYEFDDEKTIAYARENYPYCHCGAKMDGERSENGKS